MSANVDLNNRPDYDRVLQNIADYVLHSIDRLREKMVIVEDARFSREYLEADKRSIANAVQVFFTDGSSTEQVMVQYPIGHRRRRAQG